MPQMTFQRVCAWSGIACVVLLVAHTLLIMPHYIAKRQCPYQELGGDYFERMNVDTMQHRLVKKLRNLGYEVTLTPIAPTPVAQEPTAHVQ